MNLAGQIEKSLQDQSHTILQAALYSARKTGNPLVFVGGLVRDLILDKPIYDIDFMVESPSDPFVAALAQTLSAKVLAHPKFLTHALTLPTGFKVDVVTARKERYPGSGVLPEVEPASIPEDLGRRDFSVNAMACWLAGGPKGDVIDPFQGQRDLDKKVIRILHEKSFEDDPTRIFRAARFAARLGFSVEEKTEKKIRDAVLAGLPASLSPVRRRNELIMILKESRPGGALALLKSWGALASLHALLERGWAEREAEGPSSNEGKAEWKENYVQIFTRFKKDEHERVWGDLQFQREDKKDLLKKVSA